MSKFDITIIGGCGHVGFPLGLSFAGAEKKVCLLDINEKSLERIQRGIPPFKEEGAKDVLDKVLAQKMLFCSKDPASISDSKVVVLVTGTPLDEHLNPRIDLVFDVLDQYFYYFRDGQLLILRSTLYPTTSKKIHDYFVHKGKSLQVVFCPERVTEGYALKEIASLPQIISGFSNEGIERAKTLFSGIVPKVLLLTPLEAELTKLFANAYRYIHFSIANQFYQMTSQHKVDFHRIYQAMTQGYPRMENFPKPGFTAGPCLLKDTMQLASFANNTFYLGHAAMLVNEHMPKCMLEVVKANTDLKHKNIGILGMAFKGESDDKRDSLSYKLARLLKYEEAANIFCSDEYIQDPTFVTREELISKCDIIIIGAPHNEYSDLHFQGKKVFNIWKSS